jgi:hypothetical protein
VHWHQDIEAEEPRFTTFAQSSEREHDDLTSMQNSIRLEGLTFRAELSKCDTEWLELAKV